MTPNLTRPKKRELRDRGWSVTRREAERPAAIRAEDILHVGKQISLDEETAERLLTGLEDNR